MKDVITTILERRSCRSFTEESVSEEQIKTLLDCALAAPSGRGLQTWKFTAVLNREKIQKLAQAVAHALHLEDYSMYHPAAIIITSNEKDSKFREVDNACAMENIYIACEALDLGCVWINQLYTVYDEPQVRALLSEFGIPENHGVYGVAAIGHKKTVPAPKVIKGQYQIIW